MTLIWASVVNYGNQSLVVKGEVQVAKHKNQSTDTKHWGGVTRSSEEGSVMGLERRGDVRRLQEM